MRKGIYYDPDDKVLEYSRRHKVFATIILTVFLCFFFLTLSSVSVWYTSTDSFCPTCHEMRRAYLSWRLSVHNQTETGIIASCKDCHLPPGMIAQLVAKIEQGTRDTLAHYFGQPDRLGPEYLRAKAVNNVSNESCKGCHKNLFPRGIPRGGFIAHQEVTRGLKLKCVLCHQKTGHSYVSQEVAKYEPVS